MVIGQLAKQGPDSRMEHWNLWPVEIESFFVVDTQTVQFATVDLVVVLPWNVALDDAPEEEGLSLLFLSIYFATSS